VLVAELRDAGVLSPEREVASFEELLNALEGTSGVLADTVDVPPLNVAGVRASWQELRRQAADLPDAEGLERIYSELRLAARPEDRSILEISSVVALGAVRAGVRLRTSTSSTTIVARCERSRRKVWSPSCDAPAPPT
jgi:hypothetical protein